MIVDAQVVGCLLVGVSWFGWNVVLASWCVGVLVCWGWHVSEMKRAGDLFPNHPKERTDSVRQWRNAAKPFIRANRRCEENGAALYDDATPIERRHMICCMPYTVAIGLFIYQKDSNLYVSTARTRH